MNPRDFTALKIGAHVFARRGTAKLRLCEVAEHTYAADEIAPGSHPVIRVRDIQDRRFFSLYPWHVVRRATP